MINRILMRLSLVPAGVVVLLLCSCASVSVPRPFGKPVSDKKIAEELEGGWSNDDGIFWMKSLGKGEFRLASVEWNEGSEAFKLKQMSVFLRAVGERQLLFVEGQEEIKGEEQLRYFLMAFDGVKDGTAVLRSMRVDQLAAYVRDGTLAGTVEGKHTVRLEKEAEVALEELIKGQPEDVIDLKDFSVIQRVTDRKK